MTHSSGTKAFSRKAGILTSLVAAAVLGVTACGAPNTSTAAASPSDAPSKPSKPIQLTILDGGGDLKGGGQAAIDAFVKANPDLVSGVTYQTAAATDVAGKILAQASGGSVSTSLVLGGPDVLGALEKQKLVTKQIPAYSSSLPDFSGIQDTGQSAFQNAGNGNGVLVNYDPNGPFLDYLPSLKASDVPTTPDALLAWAKANPGKFSYAQPANSGSGRAFIEALPYMLGDKDPSDPANGWAKTWAYLKELGKYVTSYPSSSSLLAQQFGSGQLELIPTIIAHDVSFRKAGTYPANTGIALFQDQNWITDGHYSMIPAGVSPQTLYVDLKLESYMVSADAQKDRLTTGVLTTANKNATVDNSGQAVKDFVQAWGRPDFYPQALKTGSARVPLTPDALQTAFKLWQENVGSSVGQ
ncbi:extracellular solute-binding protein [Sinomonas humi]|uniref:extracellular solute-binding protein n=1 Tax=Sinomonas humi TaxID=1338436 RepID=UPI0018CDC0B1|nr:extracellular solute-binding protein [Sinomonas humi]